VAGDTTNRGATVIARDRETVDQACLRHYGDTAMVEAVLAANPGLADLGTHLPMGTLIRMPPKVASPVRATVNLWS
jgi:phage tail protein X